MGSRRILLLILFLPKKRWLEARGSSEGGAREATLDAPTAELVNFNLSEDLFRNRLSLALRDVHRGLGGEPLENIPSSEQDPLKQLV